VEEAAALFKAVPAIRDRMETLKRVGLDYVHVGQQATTLSGGEAQRVKLAKELARRSTGRTLYILDEPTTGLHFTTSPSCSKCCMSWSIRAIASSSSSIILK
jgi:excinuclease ABC subunit A